MMVTRSRWAVVSVSSAVAVAPPTRRRRRAASARAGAIPRRPRPRPESAAESSVALISTLPSRTAARRRRAAAAGHGDGDAARRRQVGAADAVLAFSRSSTSGAFGLVHDDHGGLPGRLEVAPKASWPPRALEATEDDVGLRHAVRFELQDSGRRRDQQQHGSHPDRPRPPEHEGTGGPPEAFLALEPGAARARVRFPGAAGPEGPERGPAQQHHHRRQQGQRGKERAEDAAAATGPSALLESGRRTAGRAGR